MTSALVGALKLGTVRDINGHELSILVNQNCIGLMADNPLYCFPSVDIEQLFKLLERARAYYAAFAALSVTSATVRLAVTAQAESYEISRDQGPTQG